MRPFSVARAARAGSSAAGIETLKSCMLWCVEFDTLDYLCRLDTIGRGAVGFLRSLPLMPEAVLRRFTGM